MNNAYLHNLRHVSADTLLSKTLKEWCAEPHISPFKDTSARVEIMLSYIVQLIAQHPQRFMEVVRTLMESKSWLLEVHGCVTAGQLHDAMDLALAHPPVKELQAFVLVNLCERPISLESLALLLETAHDISANPSTLDLGAKVGSQQQPMEVPCTLKQVMVACHVRSEQTSSAARRLQQVLQKLPAFQQLGPIPEGVLQAAFGHVARDFCARNPAENSKRAQPTATAFFTDVIYLSDFSSTDSSALLEHLHHGKLVPGFTRLESVQAAQIDACIHRCGCAPKCVCAEWLLCQCVTGLMVAPCFVYRKSEHRP